MKLHRSLYARPEIVRGERCTGVRILPRERSLLVTPRYSCAESGLSSVSNLSAQLPRDAMRSRTSPRPVTVDELGRCGAKHGAEGQCLGAALASHGRGHRFETCHAHQHKQAPQALPRPRLPADCQQTAVSGRPNAVSAGRSTRRRSMRLPALLAASEADSQERRMPA
jgi:hypothetical protein